MPTRWSLLACSTILALIAGLAAGCVNVRPWERGRLSHPCMEMSKRLGQGHRPHVLSIREGAVGGDGEAGGGCGCN